MTQLVTDIPVRIVYEIALHTINVVTKKLLEQTSFKSIILTHM